MEKLKERQSRSFSGVQRFKTPPRRSLRSIRRSLIAAYLDLYMLLIKKEAFERRNEGSAGHSYQGQLQALLQQVKQLEASRPELRGLRESVEARAGETPVAGQVHHAGRQQGWQVIEQGY